MCSDMQKFYITRVEYLNTLINYFTDTPTKEYETQADTVVIVKRCVGFDTGVC